MRSNHELARTPPRTHEGGLAARQKPELELLRTVSSCLLFENTFYEKGSDIAARIQRLALNSPATFVAELARHTRTNLHLRHVPLWLALTLVTHPEAKSAAVRSLLGADVIADVIQRADDMAEIVAMYWRMNPDKAHRYVDKRGHEQIKQAGLPWQLKLGLAKALHKFNDYQLAKWDRAKAVQLRDVLFLSHAKPRDKAEEKLWTALKDRKLPTPDTWEVALSGGADAHKTWTRLLTERKLGYDALLKNLRNITAAQVDRDLVTSALLRGAARSKALPYAFVAAWRNAPAYAAAIDTAMTEALAGAGLSPLTGRTLLIIDVSGSMEDAMSAKSEMSRMDTAGALAVVCRELCEDVRVFTFSEEAVEVQAVRGLAMVDVINGSQGHGGTYLAQSLGEIGKRVGDAADRVIVITDEQTHDNLPRISKARGYVINVAPYRPALPTASRGWTRINGFSERIVEYIRWTEAEIEDQTPKSQALRG